MENDPSNIQSNLYRIIFIEFLCLCECKPYNECLKEILSCNFKYLKIYALNNNNRSVSTICVIALVHHSIFLIDLFHNQDTMVGDF